MFVNSIVLSEVTKPFQFFCEERHTIDSLKQIILEAYNYVVKEYDDVPSLGMLQSALTTYYNYCCVERYILRPEEEYPKDHFGDVQYVKEMWKEFGGLGDDIDVFLEWYFNNHQIFSMNQELLPLFVNDVVYIMKLLNLRFHNYPGNYDSNRHYLRNPSPVFAGVVDFDINNPICEVW